MRRIVVVLALGVGLVASACGIEVSGPQTYAVSVDTASPAGKNFQYSAFFPSALTVRPGDSIVFENRSTQAPHTISFGISADRSNQPPVPGNPAVRMPCYTDVAPSPTLAACPTKAAVTPPAYTGKGYWNFGVSPFRGGAR